MDDSCVLHEACRDRDIGQIKALLNANPDLVFSRDAFGWTALHWAAEAGAKDVLALLLANRPEAVHVQDGDYGAAPLHYAAGRNRKEVAEFLLALGAHVNIGDKGRSTPLHYAARWGGTAVVGLLLAHKAEVNARDSEGCTPLHYAATGNDEVVELLRQHGGHE